jgi:hypothetical protein
MLTSCARLEDKEILEAAYNANPKPDKEARLEIVKRVSLSEKAVQVSQPGQPKPALPYTDTRPCTIRIAANGLPDMVPEPPPERPPKIASFVAAGH